MSSSTPLPRSSESSSEEDDISDTEWIVIVLVLVIVLVVLIITVAKCLEIGRDDCEKSLLKDDQTSVRSGRSTTRSVASSKSRAKSLKKMPLNAEITRFSAGRASRSAEYGVVIKDIGKLATTDPLTAQATATNQLPPHYQQGSNTSQSAPRYVQQQPTAAAAVPQQQQQAVMMTSSAAAVHSGQQQQHTAHVQRPYVTAGTLPGADSRAVFIADDDVYYNGALGAVAPGAQTMTGGAPLQLVDVGNQRYQVVGQASLQPQPQPVIIMQ